MQELRFVLIIVGALAIAALLFHGLWTSKKEGKAKFGDKPLGKLDTNKADESDELPQRSFAPEDDFEIIKKVRKEPDFSVSPPMSDPLIDSATSINEPEELSQPVEAYATDDDKVEVADIPSFAVTDVEPVLNQDLDVNTDTVIESPEPEVSNAEEERLSTELKDSELPEASIVEAAMTPQAETNQDEPEELDVIVLNVHCAGDTPFVGTELFKSMESYSLSYGEMSIFHCYASSTPSPKVIFSVANMMQPGTLEHDDPADFSTKGISFFMTLPCYGDAEQNFNIMLQTAQRIADDMGGNVLDESRNLMTPNRLSDYRKQIRDFKEARSA
ncbi:cell division protein ZipA [Vibrio makurazakiensis]|uniref:cell division protein ZipA n=1 Tax=Vibrio makurazakiensis TaxID=2910250 RepID=UPI003D0F9B7D